MRFDITRPAALSAICMVRQGVLNGAVRETAAALIPGVSAARKRRPSTRVRFIPE